MGEIIALFGPIEQYDRQADIEICFERDGHGFNGPGFYWAKRGVFDGPFETRAECVRNALDV